MGLTAPLRNFLAPAVSYQRFVLSRREAHSKACLELADGNAPMGAKSEESVVAFWSLVRAATLRIPSE